MNDWNLFWSAVSAVATAVAAIVAAVGAIIAAVAIRESAKVAYNIHEEQRKNNERLAGEQRKWEAERAEQQRKMDEERHEYNCREDEKQRELAQRANRLAYFSSLRAWAAEVVAANQAAIHLCLLDPSRVQNPSFADRRHELLCRLWALLDQGRWFFPNISQDESGHDKETAFRGYRRRILDDIAGAWHLVKQLDCETPFPEPEKQEAPWVPVPETVEFVVPWLKEELSGPWAGPPNARIRGYLIALERSFASEVQKVLDPGRLAQEFDLLTEARSAGKIDGTRHTAYPAAAANRPREER